MGIIWKGGRTCVCVVCVCVVYVCGVCVSVCQSVFKIEKEMGMGRIGSLSLLHSS